MTSYEPKKLKSINMVTFIKNRSPFLITIVTLSIIGFTMLLPTKEILAQVIGNDFKSEYVDLTLKMGVLFILGYSLVRTLKFQALAGLSRQFSWRFKYLNFIPIYLMIIGLLSVSSGDFSLIAILDLILLLIACLMVGFAEEYLFRGFIQTLFLRKYGTRKNGIFLSVLLSSIFFGLLHLVNLAKNDNTGQVLVQVVFATFIGFFFGALLLKTNRLNPIAITHGLINFFFSLALLPGIKTLEDITDDTVSIAPIIICLPLFIIGILILRKLDENEIIEKLKYENNTLQKVI